MIGQTLCVEKETPLQPSDSESVGIGWRAFLTTKPCPQLPPLSPQRLLIGPVVWKQLRWEVFSVDLKDFRLGTKAIQLPLDITILGGWCGKQLKRKKTKTILTKKKSETKFDEKFDTRCHITPKQSTFLDTLCSTISKVR